MKKLRFLAFVSWCIWPLVRCVAAPLANVEEGFALRTVMEGKHFNSFAWDEHGFLWIIRGTGNRLTVERAGAAGPSATIRSSGTYPAGLLVKGDTVFISDGGTIRVFQRNGKRLIENPPLVPPRNVFPRQTQISSLRWSPLGDIHFFFHHEAGIGRVRPGGSQWAVLARGIDGGEFSFDSQGLMVASDKISSQLFRVAHGLDYLAGLENYTKEDVAMRLDRKGLKPSAVGVYTGDQWPADNEGTWLLYDVQTSTLQQFREDENRLKHRRDLVVWREPTPVSQIQIGPDGAVWFIAADSIVRLEHQPGKTATFSSDVASLTTSEVVARLGSSNSWHRETALRVLDSREELVAARGLHPSTDLHRLLSEATNTPLARLHALWAQHRVGLLDEGGLETAADDASPLLRLWSARLFGERKYPTGTAFGKLEKMAHDTNRAVRIAVAMAARQFVSGSLVDDTPPPIMPIREVFTGGILSTLWFSTEQGSTPEFDLLFWNAVKPISAFDAAHPLGFFQGDREEKMPIAYWIITRIARQVAEMTDPLKQEDAMLMLTNLKPVNHRMLGCALRGLKDGLHSRKVIPTEKSLDVLRQFVRSQHPEVAGLAKEVLEGWSMPLPKNVSQTVLRGRDGRRERPCASLAPCGRGKTPGRESLRN